MAKNIGESVNARLRNLARQSGQDMMSVQTRYALERLLYRLTLTPWGDRIALKGALIFVAHYGDIHRPTADIDLNGYDAGGDIRTLEEMIRCAIALPVDDGVEFLADTLHIQKEHEGHTIPGGKVTLSARLGTSLVRVRVDAGFGNAVTPEAAFGEYPSMLKDMPRPRVLIYPFETMVAEKLHAMARHGSDSSRIRDYYDLWALSERRDFDGAMLAAALTATFACHGQSPPAPGLDGLSDRFVSRWSAQWDVFRKQRGLQFQPPALGETVARLRDFIEPVVAFASGGQDPGAWQSGRGWSPAPAPAPR